MKQFTTPPISVRFPNIETDDILRADFVIKESISRDAVPLAKARYTQTTSDSDDSSDILEVSLVDDVFTFQLTEEIASHLPVEDNGMPKMIWLDTRLRVQDGDTYIVPNTPIQKIRIMPTLFSEDYEEEGGEW